VATIVDLHDQGIPLPTFLLLDANLLLELLSKKSDVVQFVRRLRYAYRSGHTIPLIPIITLEECYHKILWGQCERDPDFGKYRSSAAKRLGKPPNRTSWIEVLKIRPRLIRRYYPAVDQFYQMVAAIPIQIIEPEDLVCESLSPLPLEQQMRDNMRSHFLFGKDAYLLAVAQRLKIQHIATLVIVH
jgi:hypothetical protein